MDTLFLGEWKMWRYLTYFNSLNVQKTLAVIDVTLSQPSEERSVMRLFCLEWTQTQEELKAFTEQRSENYSRRRIIAREELRLLCKARCCFPSQTVGMLLQERKVFPLTSQLKLIKKQNLSTSPAPCGFTNGQTLYEGIFLVLMSKARLFWRYLGELKLPNLNSTNV